MFRSILNVLGRFVWFLKLCFFLFVKKISFFHFVDHAGKDMPKIMLHHKNGNRLNLVNIVLQLGNVLELPPGNPVPEKAKCECEPVDESKKGNKPRFL